MAIAQELGPSAQVPAIPGRRGAYQQWIESTGMPVYRGYFVEDLRTLELGWWEERQAGVAFLELAGQEGVTEARVTEVPAGGTTAPLAMALDEAVYVVEGRGLTTVWAEDRPRKTFEWQKHSLFLIPRGYTHQYTNAQGNRPARLLHFNLLPRAMPIVPDPRFFFRNSFVNLDLVYAEDREFYSEAREIPGGLGGGRALWVGNFFPDMRAWDKLHTYQERGAGGHRVWIHFAGTRMASHMSVFPSRTYKKAHRHGPGVVIVIPAGEGYSIMWPEGEEKVVVPWHEASVFVPPDHWFHQHFNVGAEPARYLAFHGGAGGNTERVQDPQRDQIEYPDEDPFIRQKFEGELAKRDLTSLMPEECYRDRDYRWAYEDEE